MLIKNCYNKFLLPTILFSFLLLATFNLAAQIRDLERPFEPVVITGEQISEYSGVSVDAIFVAAYNSASGAWQIIPFQIDERDTSGSLLVPDVNAGLDADDEIVFMAKDAGDRAPKSWLDNSESENFQRIEIAVIDAADMDKTAWIYVYHIPENQPDLNPTDYVTYLPNTTEPAADSIAGKTYKIANALNGLPNFLAIPPEAGGAGLDILEKQEVSIGSSIGFSLNETNNFISDSVSIKDGNIRVIRELFIDIVLLGTPLFPDLTLPVIYYGYSLDIRAYFIIPEELPLNIRITEIRQSFNLNANAAGMKLYSANNSGIPIDGSPENIDDRAVLFPDGVNRLLFTGTMGNFVNVFTVPALGISRKLYYQDNASSGSYGNAGFVLTGSDIEGPTPLGLSILFPGAVTPGEESNFTKTGNNGLVTEISAQSFDEVTSVKIVTKGAGIPQHFSLSQNFPNPFNPSTEIQYQLPESVRNASLKNKTELKIYNLLGKEIRTLVEKDQSPGSYSVTWDAKNNSGKDVPSGVYFYQLNYGDFSETKKLILVK